MVSVPQHISDLHGLDEPESLFGYLNQIRIAYMIGADFAAIAMCRATTEILIRRHFNDNDQKTKLSPLIKATESRAEYRDLKKFNLVMKVDSANEVLHGPFTTRGAANRARTLVPEWVRELEQMMGIVKPRPK